MVVAQGSDVRLCGPLEISVAGQNLASGLPGRQGRLLLAYLVQNRSRAVPRSELLEILWGPEIPATADGALSALLSKLRKALGADGISGRGDVRLTLAEPVRVDAEQAERAARDAEIALAGGDPEAASAFARVALAVDVQNYLPDVQDPWVQDRRETLRAARSRALETLAASGLSMGGPELAAAEQAARTVIAEAPYRESAHRLLMEIHEAAGNHAEALRAFDDLRTRLREELNASPSQETMSIFERLLRGEPVAEPEREIVRATWPPALHFARGRHPFIGREADLDILEGHWREAAGGARKLVVLTGEDGIGKSRLAAEFGRRVHEEGAVVLYGRFDEETLAPYKPVLEMLRGWAAGNGLAAERERLSSRAAAALGLLVPELASEGGDGSPAAPSDGEAARLQLFDSVAELLAVIARRAPLLVIVDDLQWADRPTLALLRHLVTGSEPRRCMFLAAHNDSVADGSPALGELFDGLRRASALDRHAVGGLSPQEVADLARSFGAWGSSSDFLEALHQQTEGNPFFVEEVVHHLEDSEAAVPEGIRDLAARRLAGLTPNARTTLGVAAVLGRDWEFDLLEAVAPIHGDMLLESLEEAAAAGLVREREGNRWAFRHAMVRAALQDGFSALRRARIHAAAADALIALHAADHEPWLASIASHLERAAPVAEPGRAIEFALAAARRADRQLAWEEAAEHYRAAIRILGDEDARRRCDLLIELGAALRRAGLPEARDAFAEAMALARELADSDLVTRATLGFAGPWSTLARVDDDMVDLLEEALEQAGEQDSELRVRVLSRLSLELYYCGFPERRLDLSAEAVEIARRLGEPSALAVALDARHYALWRPETVQERLEVARELRSLATSIGDPELELEGCGWGIVDLLELGDVRAADIELDAAHARAEELRRPLYQWWTAVMRAALAQLRGDLREAERLAEEGLAIGRRTVPEQAVHYYAMGMFQTRREQGRIEEAVDPVRHFVAAYPAIPAWRAVLALAHAELGDLEGARREFDVVAEAGFENLPPDAQWLIGTTVLGEVAGILRDEPRARELMELLEPYASRNVIVGRAASCNGSVARVLGILADCLDDGERADRHFGEALSQHNAMGARLWAARTRVAWARSLLRRAPEGDASSRAHDLLADAVITADALGLTATGKAARSLLSGLSLHEAG